MDWSCVKLPKLTSVLLWKKDSFSDAELKKILKLQVMHLILFAWGCILCMFHKP